jgi:hypothetical protein
MKKSLVLTAVIALSGGVAGVIFFLAASHLNDRALSGGLNLVFLFLSIVLFSILFPLAWLLFSAYFIKTFNSDPGKTMKETGLIFMAPLPAAAGLVPLMLFYGRLAALKLKVVGFIYLPFVNYLHVNPAGYYLFTLFGFILVTAGALLLFKFAFLLYNSGKAFDDRRRALMVFGSLLVFFAVATAYVTVIYPPTGDEPHYLTISQSMANDLDLNLENNYTEGRYKEFYPVDIDYKSIHNTVDKNGKGIYSLHFAGLPALIAALQRVSGRFGVQLFMNFITAALAALFYLFLRGSHIAEKTATAAAYIIFTAAPFSIASSLVMTEVPAALVILYSIMRLSNYKKEEGSLLLFAGIAFLPWLHPKLVIFSLVFYAWHYLNVAREKTFDIKKEAINNLLPLASFALMAVFYYSIFGKFAPFAITSIYKTPGSYFAFTLKHFLHSAAAVVFDRDYGLLVYAPIYITAFFGLAYALIRDGLKKAAPAAACLPYLVMFLFWNDWGGSMYPARQLIPILPVAGYYAAYFMQERSFINKKFFKFLAGFSILISYGLMIVPALRYFSGREKIYSALMKLKFNILWFFPSFSDIIGFRHMIIVLYILVIMILFVKYAEIRKKT